MKTFFNYFIILSFIAPSVAWGSIPNPFQEAIDHLQAGKELYYKLSFEESLKHLSLAQKNFEAKALHLTRGEYLFDAYIFSALCHFSQKKLDLARSFVENAYRLNPKRTLQEESFSPPFVEFFKKTASQLSLKTSTLEVHSVPAFSTV